MLEMPASTSPVDLNNVAHPGPIPGSSSRHKGVAEGSTASAEQQYATSESPLVAFPTEIMQTIFHHLLLPPEPLNQMSQRLSVAEDRRDYRYQDVSWKWHYYQNKSFNLHPQILRVCHHLYKLGWHILYKQNTWLFRICHPRRAGLGYVTPRYDGRQACSADPFQRDYLPSSLGAAVRNMDKFTFDIRIEREAYKGWYGSEEHYFLQPGDELRNLLTGSNKEVIFDIKLPSMDHCMKPINHDQYVTDLTKFFSVFKGVRCGTVHVLVDGVHKDTDLAKVMTSNIPIDEALPEKLATYQQYMVQYEERFGFPYGWHQRVIHAAQEWKSEEFQKWSESVVDAVDEILQEEREKFNQYKAQLLGSRPG